MLKSFLKIIGMIAAGTACLLAPVARALTQAPADARVHVRMQDVVLYPLDDAPSQVIALSGIVAPTRPGHLVVFDDVTSYEVRVARAEMRLPAASMTALMNRVTLPAANGPIRHVEVSFGQGTIEMKGTMVKLGAPIGFTASAVAEPSPSGDMRIRVVRMTAAGIMGKGLMDALGLKMSVVAQPQDRRVFHIEGDTMIVPVVSMFPPPRFVGSVRSVSVTPQGLRAVVGGAAPDAAPAPAPPQAGPYLAYRGGALHFAKLTMQDADLTILPRDPNHPFGFSPAQYYRQLQAGFTLSTPDRGLVSRVPDYATLPDRR